MNVVHHANLMILTDANIRPEIDLDAREQKADILDRMEALARFSPKDYVPRHAAR